MRAHCPLQPLLCILPGLIVHCSHCSASHQHCTHRTKLSNTSFDIQGTLRQGVELAVDWGQWGCSLGGQWRVPLVAIWGQWKKKEKGVGEESHTHTHTHIHTHTGWMKQTSTSFNEQEQAPTTLHTYIHIYTHIWWMEQSSNKQAPTLFFLP